MVCSGRWQNKSSCFPLENSNEGQNCVAPIKSRGIILYSWWKAGSAWHLWLGTQKPCRRANTRNWRSQYLNSRCQHISLLKDRSSQVPVGAVWHFSCVFPLLWSRIQQKSFLSQLWAPRSEEIWQSISGWQVWLKVLIKRERMHEVASMNFDADHHFALWSKQMSKSGRKWNIKETTDRLQ